MNLLHLMQDAFRQALTGYAADVEKAVAMVKPAQDSQHGDYQANCAMSLAKPLGKKPRDVAQEIIDRLPLGDMLEKPEIAGPGFINLRLRNDWLAKQLQTMAADDRLTVGVANPPKTYVIDYSSPNVAKPMHVGHLRSTIIGDCLARLLRFLGNRVIGDNHVGDWGTQFGMLLYGYKNFLDKQALEADPVAEMLRLYLLVRNLIKPAEQDEDEGVNNEAQFTPQEVARGKEVADAARQETAKLHGGDLENLRLWQQFMPWCLEVNERIYRRLDVHFDFIHGESFYQPMLADVVDDLLKKGIAQESKGAIVIFFGEGKPPAMVRKTDGAFTYTTSDLATIRYRTAQWHPDAMLYVVDARQALHFQNLFEAARRWGYDKVELEHTSFGSVLGEDRKPLKTREGGVVELTSLLDEAVDLAADVYEQTRQERMERGEEVPQLGDQERREIAEGVGLGAVKYADLCQNRTTDYVFSWEKMLAMTGNTGTYMQYAYARNRSILRKGDADLAQFRTNPATPLLESDHERALALSLLRFEEALYDAASAYQPNAITNYLWDLAKTYSGFFQFCPVLKAPTPELRQSRLLLCDLTARVIQRGLDLLGIRTVERM
ncbi:MAG TPA: arginine--tRNA ligase [Gemmataceae bacterium]|nr:arginine--tRNA ligase [Gemmataceae bacterium]